METEKGHQILYIIPSTRGRDINVQGNVSHKLLPDKGLHVRLSRLRPVASSQRTLSVSRNPICSPSVYIWYGRERGVGFA